MRPATSPALGAWPAFIVVGLGYLAAVVIASLVVIFILAATEGRVDSSIFPILAVGCAFTFGYAFPGFIVTVLIAYWLRLREWFFFVIAGGLDGALALAIFSRLRQNADFTLVVVAGGAADGLVYWSIAYRLRRMSA